MMTCACAIAAVLAGCDSLHRENPKNGDEMHWARAALDRNPDLSVLAEDDGARVFTVKLAASGEVRVVPLAQLIAGPAVAEAAQPPGTEAPAPRLAAGEIQAQPADTRADATATDSLPAAPSPEAPTLPAATTGTPAAAPGAGRVLASGPGYSIAAASPSARNAPSAAARQAAARTSAGGNAPQITRTVAESRSEPIICQGNRRLRIDGQNLEFSGDAVTAEKGCDLHITNSRIRATGIAVNARAASVHVENSIIEGADSIDASQGAQIYIQTSTFKGLSRRLDTAQLHDLGGNVWN